MDYTLTIKVDRQTEKDDPKTMTIRIPGGYFESFSFLIPPGHCGLTGLQVWFEGSQFLPTTRGEWYVGDNIYRVVPVRTELPYEWNEFEVRAYNTDDSYDHTFYVYFAVTHENIAKDIRELIRLFTGGG